MVMNNSIYNQVTANLEILKLTQMQIHLDEVCRHQNNADYLRLVHLSPDQTFLPE